MTEAAKSSLSGAVSQIFSVTSNQRNARNFSLPKHNKEKIKELELAMVVVLVDLASCDQNFEPREYQIILSGLKRMFGSTREQVQALVNQATIVLRNLRGTSRFSQMLKEELSLEQRQIVMEIVDDMVDADGQKDGFEVYFRARLATILGIENQESKPS
jgi:uncharacterized tellurite resistance protein B-like protein